MDLNEQKVATFGRIINIFFVEKPLESTTCAKLPDQNRQL